MANPITTGDIYQNTGELQELLRELQAIREELTALRNGEVKKAAELEGVVKGLNNVYSSHRDQIAETSKQADELKRRYDKYSESLTDNARKIAAVKNAQRQINQVNKLDAIIANNKVGTYDRLSAQYSLNKIQLNRMTVAERESTVAGRKLEKQTNAIFQEMKRLQERTGKNVLSVGDYTKATDKLTASLRDLAFGYVSLSGAERLVQTIFNQTKELDALNLAYEKTIPNEQRRAQTENFLIELSEKYGVQLLETRRAYLRYNAAVGQTNLTTEQTQRIFESVTKASAALGLDVQKTDRVFNALEQIMSKGVVSSEELRQQLGDSLPGSMRIMADALGVTTLELSKMLANGEVLAEDAIPKFAAQLEKAYGIETLDRIESLTASQGRFTTEVTKTIEKLEASGTIAAFFDTMRDGVAFIGDNIKAIVNLTKFVALAAAAYVTWRTSMLLTNKAQSIGVALTYKDIAAKGLLNTTLALTTRAFNALKLAIASNPIGFIATVLVSAATAMALFNEQVEKSGKLVRDVFAEAKKSIIEEKRAVEQLLKVAKDETETKEERAKAIKKLNEISPEYLGNITSETIKTGEARVAVDKYIESLLRQARVKAAQRALDKLEDERIDAINNGTNARVSLLDRLKNSTLALGNVAATTSRNIQTSVKNQIAAEEEYLRKRQKLIAILENEGFGVDDIGSDSPDGGGGGGGSPERVDPFKAEELRISAMEAGQAKELALLDLNFKKRKLQFEKHGVDVSLLEEQVGRQRASIIAKYERISQQEYQNTRDAQIKIFEENQALQEKEVDLSAATETEKAEFALKQRQQLLDNIRLLNQESQGILPPLDTRELELQVKEAEKALLKVRRDTALESFGIEQELEKSKFDLTKATEAEKTVFRLQQERERLAKILELERQFGETLTRQQVEIIQNQIQAIDQQIEASRGQVNDIFDVFGFRIGDEQKQALMETFGFLKGLLNELTQARLDAADREVQATNEVVAARQRDLQNEIESRNAGYAHSVQTAARRLDQARKNQQDALREQKKAQKEQQEIQTLEQSLNLTTASAKIWKSFSGLGPAGPFLASAAIALMWGSFLSAKIRASQLAKKRFRKGYWGVLGGGSHESGNDTPLGFQVEGKAAYAERDEGVAVFPAKQTRKYRSVLPDVVKSLIRGDFEQRYTKVTEATNQSSSPTNIQVNAPQMDNGQMANDISQLRQQGERRWYTDSRGRTVMQYKNLTVVYE